MASVPIPLAPHSQPDLSSLTPPPESTDSFSDADMDAILRDIQSVTPDTYTGVLGNGETLPNGGSTSKDTHTPIKAGDPTFPDVAGLEQTSNSTESGVLQAHDFDFGWIDKLGAELLNGLKEIIPPFPDNLGGDTGGEIAGESTTSNFLDGGFHLGNTVGNGPFAASASDESHTNVTGHVTEAETSPLSGSNTDQPARTGYIDIDAALKNLLG
ncbi:hypothetical protein EX30DRAFT_36832 [Ascodesmis nigricans]|uniref:Uncharacterized protein n=1 Tax=Ascodesmis nigricans TaxID=341454 RepID=A0A4S2MWP6_9PEZI|nr:hypothetical protein EX30DRAFT_36832 [Ascodesmis nigricans]